LLVSVFSIHITSPKAHREEADLSGSDGDNNDDSGMDEKEAEAKVFEEIKRIFGLPDDFKEIPETLDSNPEKHHQGGAVSASYAVALLKKFCKN
jgi:hypothetical protein